MSTAIPLLIPRSQRQNVALQQTLPQLTTQFQIREIDDSVGTPGDLILPSLGIACLFPSIGLEDTAARAGVILQRRRCIILVPADEMLDFQLRYFVHKANLG
jgi:hypothetical protein